MKARHSIIGDGNVRLSQAQFIDILLPELIEQVAKVNSLAQVALSIKRIGSFLESLKTSFVFISLFKRCYLIISEVKKAVKKRELDQKYFAKDFDTDLMM